MMEKLPSDPVELLKAMKETDTLDLFEDLVMHHLRKTLQEDAIPQFLKNLSDGSFQDVMISVENLFTAVNWYFDYISVWDNAKDLQNQMKQLLKSCLNWSVHSGVYEQFEMIFTYAFQFVISEYGYDMEVPAAGVEIVSLQWKSKKEIVSVIDFSSIIKHKFQQMTCTWLPSLGLMSKFCEIPLVNMLETEIDRYIKETCSGEFERRWVDGSDGELERWLNTRVMRGLELLFHIDFSSKSWKQTLLHIVYASYTKLRISEMLNVITEFPESVPVICDLKMCLQHTRQRPRLIESLKNDFRNRVFHPGVSTQNIISVYISAVKALRELDPSGVVMEMVLEPCTTYLTRREDAVRTIMQGLLGDDGSNDLAAELAKRQEPNDGQCWNERTTQSPDDWMPDPREADPHKVDKSSRTSDIVTLFIGMYGSKEKFIKEYQKLLSKRLLHTWCGEKSEAAEIRNLELLKMRFGEDDMNKCEVMLKDIGDSRRINTYVKQEYQPKNDVQPAVEVHTMIVSSQFWPDIAAQDMEVPEPVQQSLEQFAKGFEQLKASRTLKWLGGVGLVELELELEDRNLNFSVTPLLASLIHHFAEKDTWTLTELSDKVKVTPTVLRRKMSFWLQQGVLKETQPDTYTTIERNDKRISGAAASGSFSQFGAGRAKQICEDDDDEEKSNSDAEKDKREKNEQVFWNYVQGMLKNFASLPIDRIHKMLQMFAMHDADMQIEMNQLRQLLNDKVRKGLLAVEQGKYQLVRDPS